MNPIPYSLARNSRLETSRGHWMPTWVARRQSSPSVSARRHPTSRQAGGRVPPKGKMAIRSDHRARKPTKARDERGSRRPKGQIRFSITSAKGRETGTGGRARACHIVTLEKMTHLEQLHLLMFTQHKLGRFPPLRGVFPTVFDQARRMSIDLDGGTRANLAMPPHETCELS